MYHRNRITSIPDFYAFKDGLHLVGSNGSILQIDLFILVRTLFQTLIPNLIVSGLTDGKRVVLCQGNLWVNMMEVGTIVGNIQLTIAIDQRQVTITVQSTYTTSTDRDEVTVIDIVDRSCSITEYSRSISKNLGRTGRGVTTGKYSVVDNDTFLVDIRLANSRPFSLTGILITQIVQV